MPTAFDTGAPETPANSVRAEHRNLSVRELLHLPPSALLGVSPNAAAVLATLGIDTIFDLATSRVFVGATRLLNASGDHRSEISQHGSPPSDLVDEAVTAGREVDELPFLPLNALEAIPAAEVAAVEAALDVRTVRDLALYPPYRAAARMLASVYFPENAPDYDAERPADLLPKTGEYPTERVQYSTIT